MNPHVSRFAADTNTFFGGDVLRYAECQPIGTSSTTSSSDSKCG